MVVAQKVVRRNRRSCCQLEDGSTLECVNRFCYLGEMLEAAGGCGEASRTRVRGAWGQFKEFAEFLNRRGIPLRQKRYASSGYMQVECTECVGVCQ